MDAFGTRKERDAHYGVVPLRRVRKRRAPAPDPPGGISARDASAKYGIARPRLAHLADAGVIVRLRRGWYAEQSLAGVSPVAHYRPEGCLSTREVLERYGIAPYTLSRLARQGLVARFSYGWYRESSVVNHLAHAERERPADSIVKRARAGGVASVRPWKNHHRFS